MTVVPRYAPYAGVEPTGVSVPLDLPHSTTPSAAKSDKSGGRGTGNRPATGNAQHTPGLGDASQEGAAAAQAEHADLWECRQGGVRRVFVEHPLFTTSGRGEHGTASPVNACRSL